MINISLSLLNIQIPKILYCGKIFRITSRKLLTEASLVEIKSSEKILFFL